MPLSLREKLTMLMPPSLFYGRRITEEARSGEPELAILAKLVSRGGTAIDVGANQGVFAYALSDDRGPSRSFRAQPRLRLLCTLDVARSRRGARAGTLRGSQAMGPYTSRFQMRE